VPGAIHFQQDGSIARVTLEHPGKFNSMSRAMWVSLRGVFESIQRDPQVRCVVLSGAQGHFCSGGDIEEYPAFRFEERALRAFHEEDVWGALHAMLQCDVPMLAQIDGYCMGAGLEVASCCDLRMAAVSARFAAPIARLGFPMAPREVALLSAALGLSATRAMLLAASTFESAQLLASGFLTTVVPDDQLGAQCEAVAQRIASLAPQAARLNKQTLRALNPAVARIDSAQAASILIAAYAYADSAEHREGILAFLAKRKPQF